MVTGTPAFPLKRHVLKKKIYRKVEEVEEVEEKGEKKKNRGVARRNTEESRMSNKDFR
jgi:hypothetical protein